MANLLIDSLKPDGVGGYYLSNDRIKETEKENKRLKRVRIRNSIEDSFKGSPPNSENTPFKLLVKYNCYQRAAKGTVKYIDTLIQNDTYKKDDLKKELKFIKRALINVIENPVRINGCNITSLLEPFFEKFKKEIGESALIYLNDE